jgi:hypothetical protein
MTRQTANKRRTISILVLLGSILLMAAAWEPSDEDEGIEDI